MKKRMGLRSIWQHPTFVAVFMAGFVLLNSSAQALELKLAVAANFAKPAHELGRAYENKTGTAIKVASGSTGTLFAQIRNGAPYDLFLAADTKRPKALVDLGLAPSASYFVYAQGVLALYRAAKSTDQQQPPEALSRQLKAQLLERDFRFLALANPKTAPYGRAAVQVLANFGLHDISRVQGESIGHAFQFVATGNAELGFVALSQILSLDKEKRGPYWQPAPDSYGPILQAAVILERSQHAQEAKQFAEFLRSKSGRHIIQSYGYALQ